MVEAALGTGPPDAAPSAPGCPGHIPLGTRVRHRITAPSPAVRGRVVVAAVAAGAFVAAGQTMDKTAVTVIDDPALVASAREASSTIGLGGAAPAPEFLPVTRPAEVASADAVQAMAKGQRLVDDRVAREAEASRVRFVMPTKGIFTSGYGGRWGVMHWGIDLANSIGTPILAAADGVVVESGPASGFGLWIRIQHSDGTTTVYGHINRSLVAEGQRVRAGQEIAEMGNRGNSTGPHLHFEVWNAAGQKINPIIWLHQHGIDL
ncbi:MAG TPA: M23 family metallopeptidase [Pseudonocardiaceae bacterium]|nr:M23 family metallopeptidase [Pseudonocardiaceae bacterium]